VIVTLALALTTCHRILVAKSSWLLPPVDEIKGHWVELHRDAHAVDQCLASAPNQPRFPPARRPPLRWLVRVGMRTLAHVLSLAHALARYSFLSVVEAGRRANDWSLLLSAPWVVGLGWQLRHISRASIHAHASIVRLLLPPSLSFSGFAPCRTMKQQRSVSARFHLQKTFTSKIQLPRSLREIGKTPTA
jgi:hypothetical protein